YNGSSVEVVTTEYTEEKGYYEATALFKKYPSYKESLLDYASKLRYNTSTSDPYIYSGTWIENTSSYLDATKALTGVWAADPSYKLKLNDLIKRFSLQEYDEVASYEDENEKAANKLYEKFQSAYYVSDLWNIAQEFKEVYPDDARVNEVVLVLLKKIYKKE